LHPNNLERARAHLLTHPLFGGVHSCVEVIAAIHQLLSWQLWYAYSIHVGSELQKPLCFWFNTFDGLIFDFRWCPPPPLFCPLMLRIVIRGVLMPVGSHTIWLGPPKLYWDEVCSHGGQTGPHWDTATLHIAEVTWHWGETWCCI